MGGNKSRPGQSTDDGGLAQATRNSVVLLVWLNGMSIFPRPLSLNVLREIAEYIMPSFPSLLIKCEQGTVYFIDPETAESQVLFPSRFPALNILSSFLVPVDLRRVFVCGGSINGQATPHSYFFLPERIQALQDMRTPRTAHGATLERHTAQVLVFGGWSDESMRKPKRTCEAFDLRTAEWRKLPDMRKARANTTPCIHHTCVYLCGGDSKGTVEVMDLLAGKFRLIPIGALNPGGTTAVVVAGLLVILSDYISVEVDLESGETLERRRGSSIGVDRRPVCPPVVVGNTVHALYGNTYWSMNFKGRERQKSTY